MIRTAMIAAVMMTGFAATPAYADDDGLGGSSWFSLFYGAGDELYRNIGAFYRNIGAF